MQKVIAISALLLISVALLLRPRGDSLSSSEGEDRFRGNRTPSLSSVASGTLEMEKSPQAAPSSIPAERPTLQAHPYGATGFLLGPLAAFVGGKSLASVAELQESLLLYTHWELEERCLEDSSLAREYYPCYRIGFHTNDPDDWEMVVTMWWLDENGWHEGSSSSASRELERGEQMRVGLTMPQDEFPSVRLIGAVYETFDSRGRLRFREVRTFQAR